MIVAEFPQQLHFPKYAVLMVTASHREDSESHVVRRA
jgi:hypothetical protein